MASFLSLQPAKLLPLAGGALHLLGLRKETLPPCCSQADCCKLWRPGLEYHLPEASPWDCKQPFSVFITSSRPFSRGTSQPQVCVFVYVFTARVIYQFSGGRGQTQCLLWVSICWLRTVLHTWTFFSLATKTDVGQLGAKEVLQEVVLSGRVMWRVGFCDYKIKCQHDSRKVVSHSECSTV